MESRSLLKCTSSDEISELFTLKEILELDTVVAWPDESLDGIKLEELSHIFFSRVCLEDLLQGLVASIWTVFIFAICVVNDLVEVIFVSFKCVFLNT